MDCLSFFFFEDSLGVLGGISWQKGIGMPVVFGLFKSPSIRLLPGIVVLPYVCRFPGNWPCGYRRRSTGFRWPWFWLLLFSGDNAPFLYQNYLPGGKPVLW